jgi:hypothetical protein
MGLMTIFYYLKFETPNLVGQVPVFISLHEQGNPIIPQALVFFIIIIITAAKSKSPLSYDQRSVGQSVLVSGHHPGITTNFFLFHENSLMTFVVFLLWTTERMGL